MTPMKKESVEGVVLLCKPIHLDDILERLSNESRKSKISVITTANQEKGKYL